MPVHDWQRVDSGIFHAFHVAWIPELSGLLNGGILPEGYYALPEQHAGDSIADILTLHTSPQSPSADNPASSRGGAAVAELSTKVRRRETFEGSQLARRRSLAIRHVSGHRLIALVEILSPGNKERARNLEAFAAKVVSALDAGIHVLLVDLFPPGRHDPQGIDFEIARRLVLDYAQPNDSRNPQESVTIASYAAEASVESFIDYVALGRPLPDAPLFIGPDRFVKTPLEDAYQAAYRSMPAFWRDVIEGKTTDPAP